MLSGAGAAEFGGRWNSIGVPAVYCSESLSLCALEILVHLPRSVLNRYMFIEIEIPDERVKHLKGKLINEIAVSQQIGDKLLGPDGELAFSAPSVVNPLERNIIINPEHPDVWMLRPGQVQPFPIDNRLVKR